MMSRQKRLLHLRRRADFLKERIANYSGKNDSFDRAELSSLCWVIGIIEKLVQNNEIETYDPEGALNGRRKEEDVQSIAKKEP